MLFPSIAAFAESPSPSFSALPRIMVKDGAFVERESGKSFQPRGFHYIRLHENGTHFLLNPDLYDAEAAEAMLQDLEDHGFNLVRIFLGLHGVGGPDGLHPVFVENFIDFLERATRHGIYVIPVRTHLPESPRYKEGLEEALAKEFPEFKIAYDASRYMSDFMITAKERFLKDLVSTIRDHDPKLLSTIFAYELENESCVLETEPPFTLDSGEFQPANGKSYHMRNREQVQALLDDSAIYWADRCVEAVHEVDPLAMVSTSVFTYLAVGRTGPGYIRQDDTQDHRVPLRPQALARSKLSYVDIHFYVGAVPDLRPHLESIEFSKLRNTVEAREKALFIGEIGAVKEYFPQVEEAAETIPEVLDHLMHKGFAGYCYWTYDTEEQDFLWHGKSAGGVMLRALAARHQASPETAPAAE